MTDPALHPERAIYHSPLHYVWNQVLFPLKMIVPQPAVRRLPGLTTNEDIRVGMVLKHVRGRLLDIGCGKNRLARAYRAAGGDGIGVDAYDWGNVDLVVPNTAHLPYDRGSFETISFVACLNHIPNRAEVLLEASRLLAPSGRLLVTNLSPGISRLWHWYAFWDEDQHKRGMKDGEVYGFSRAELHSLLEASGFRVTGRVAFSWGLNSLYVCERRDNGGDAGNEGI